MTKKILIGIGALSILSAVIIAIILFLGDSESEKMRPEMEVMMEDFYQKYNEGDFDYINEELFLIKQSQKGLKIFDIMKNSVGDYTSRDKEKMNIDFLYSAKAPAQYTVTDYTTHEKIKTFSIFIFMKDKDEKLKIYTYSVKERNE